MTTKRPPGTGEIEERGGAFRARLPRSMGRKAIGTFATEEEACTVLDAALAELAEGSARLAPGAVTLRSLSGRFWARRKANGARGIVYDRSRWRAHVETAHFIDWPLESVTSRDVRRWRDEMQRKRVVRRHRAHGRTGDLVERGEDKPLARTTISNAMHLLHQAFALAVEDGLLAHNPATDVRLTRKEPRRTREPWTYLAPEEQEALVRCSAVPLWARLLVAFAIGTGLRKGELWCLELADLHVGGRPHVVVRYGSPGQLPKSGKIRTVPLFGLALEAAEAWLALLPTYAKKNPAGLVWPTRRGKCRHGLRLPLWRTWLAAAGIARRVRLHDLRHTCASSLVAGWWGRRWSLEEAKELLGHASIKTTERYAHLADGVLHQAAAATLGPRTVGATAPSCPQEIAPKAANQARLALAAWSTEPRVGCSNHPGRAEEEEIAGGTLGAAAQQLLQVVAAGRDASAALAELRGALEAHPVARMLRAAGGPHELTAALEVAKMLLDEGAPVRRAQGRGT